MPGQTDSAQVKASAGEWFDKIGPRRVAALFLPGQEAYRARVRRTLCEAAAFFTGLLASNGLVVEQTEQRIELDGLGTALNARPDFVLGPRPVVIDAKWGGLRWRRSSLEDGTASQLAFYAWLVHKGHSGTPPLPGVGYLIVTDQSLVTTDNQLRSPAEFVDGRAWGETWDALERAFHERTAELGRGQLVAPANPDEEGNSPPDRSEIDERGRLILKPSCRFCHLGALCGLDLAEGGA